MQFSSCVNVFRHLLDLTNALKTSKVSSALVGSSGLEPPTFRLSGERSNQLSYEPIQSVSRTLKIEQC